MKKISLLVLGVVLFLFFLSPKHIPSPVLSIQELPNTQVYSGTIVSNDGSQTTPYNLTIKKTNQLLIMQLKNKAYECTSTLNETALLLEESELFLVPDKKSHFDKKIFKNITEPTLSFFNKGTFIKTMSLSPDTAYPFQSINAMIPYLQAASFLQNTQFYIEWVLPNVYWTQQLEVQKTIVTHISDIPHFKRFPKSVADNLSQKMPFIMYSLKPVGMSSIFINEQYLYCFDLEKPHRFIGSWGGPKPHLMYQLIL